MYITIACFVIFAICLAMIFNEGLWGAAIMFVNVMLSAMIATNFYEPLSTWLDKQDKSYTYLVDFVAVWAIFCLTLVILRVITDKLSRYRVRFKKPVDIGGGVFFAAWIGWIMVQFTLFTMHVSPLARNFFGGDFQPDADSKMFMGTAPDRNWMALMHKMGKEGSLGTGEAFDPQGDFVLRYGFRREAFEGEKSLRVQ